ncbi:MAG: phosphate ABC transporter permease family protein, partial [Marinicella sp.]
MNISVLIFLLLLFAAFSFFMARQKITIAYHQQKQKKKILTLPKYFGYVAALSSLLPALAILLFLQIVEEPYINSEISAYLLSNEINSNDDLDLYLNEIRSADTTAKVSALSDEKQNVYQRLHEIETTTNRTITVVVLAISILLAIWAMRKINTDTP